MERQYKNVIREQFSAHNQMVLISGPRQVGKTTLAQSIGQKSDSYYFNWDDFNDREVLIAGGQRIAAQMKLDELSADTPLVIFDEIHKYRQWKQLLKGFYDRYKDRCHILITGSARLDVYKQGGDSLMGRYFSYRLHPLSVNEMSNRTLSDQEVQNPAQPDDKDFEKLLRWGGFPEPFLKNDPRFFNRWSKLREQQLLTDDIRDLTNVQELGQLQILAVILKRQVGQLTSYTSLAKKVRVSVDTIRRWIVTLESLYFCFSIRPWSNNVSRSLIKEPKYYLWDWSQCEDRGTRHENFIASHLLKAVHFWNDLGYGSYALHFIRDKEKREVDFLVAKDGSPWIMVEVKTSAKNGLSPSLTHFADRLDVDHVYQVVVQADYIDRNVFDLSYPVIVPAKTLLSQLP